MRELYINRTFYQSIIIKTCGRIAIYTIVYQITGMVGLLVRVIQIFDPNFFVSWLHYL
jgi:hypothetical protein